jgi:succinate dehydrogenase / fumarate reductase, cytochrome b subunit
MNSSRIPRTFVTKRVHSLTGIWLVLYIIQHLFVNAQAALFFGDDGSGFIKAVNSIHSLPFLPIIEIGLLGFPILIHGIWGIEYMRNIKYNSFKTDGTTPALPMYPRNKAYTWQRITAWLLIFGIIAHVIHMRFLEYPQEVRKGQEHLYLQVLNLDEGLYSVAYRLNVNLYDHRLLEEEKERLTGLTTENSHSLEARARALLAAQQKQESQEFLDALNKYSLGKDQVLAISKNFGTSELLMLRETFKMPLMLVFYTLLVLATCYHAFNGLWTAMVTWGITLSAKSQRVMLTSTQVLMVLVSFLGLAAVWGTYWINLKQ